MALFVAIVVSYLFQVIYCLALTILGFIIIFFLICLIHFGDIDSNGQSEAFLLLLLLIILTVIFSFFFCQAFIKVFKLLKRCEAINNLRSQALNSSIWRFFINWPLVMALATMMYMVACFYINDGWYCGWQRRVF